MKNRQGWWFGTNRVSGHSLQNQCEGWVDFSKFKLLTFSKLIKNL